MIHINGKTYSGNSITINNGKVIIDGKDCSPDAKEINIHVEGSVEVLNADVVANLKIDGSAGSVKTVSGDVTVYGGVGGAISTVNGDVDCEDVAGTITTVSGNIKHKRTKIENQ